MSLGIWEAGPVRPHRWQGEATDAVIAAVRRRQRGIVSAVMGSGKTHVTGALCRAAMRGAHGRAIVVLVPSARLVVQTAATLAQWCGADEVGQFYGRKKQAARAVVVCCNPSLPKLLEELGDRGCALLIVDEAHRSEGAVLLDGIPRLHAAAQVGLTATPLRSLPRERLTLWDEVVYRYNMNQALVDGVLVPLRVERWRGGAGVPLDEACLEMMREHGRGPGIVDAVSIEDAESYAAWCVREGMPMLPIHSELSGREQSRRLRALHDGDVRALCHVSLLAEGVDYPWLRWICMRRKVGASVRFWQQLGRPCRRDWDDPTKTECVIMDPHMLLGRFGLTPLEAIGELLEEIAAAEAIEPSARGDVELPITLAVCLDTLLAHLEFVRRAMESANMITVRRFGVAWQFADVSGKQVEAITRWRKYTRYAPADYRDALKALAWIPYALTRGQASLLIDVLLGGARWCWAEAERLGLEGRDRWSLHWEMPEGVPGVPVDNVAALEKEGRKIARRRARGTK